VGVFGEDLIRGLLHEAREILRGVEWVERSAADEVERLEGRDPDPASPHAPAGAGDASGDRLDSAKEPLDRTP
jgi:hypothetical protein